MNKYLTFILLVFFFGCSSINQLQNSHQLSKDEIIVNEILANTAALIKREKGLQPAGSGGQMMHEVKMLELAFIYNKPIEVEEGRKLLVYAVETFVSQINNDERIHPYLYKYPFEPKNVEIRIAITNPNYSSVEPGKLCLLTAIRGKCQYKADDPKSNLFKMLCEESFDEAQKKVKENESL